MSPMDPQLQKRLIGAAVLIVLAAIFLPMLLDGPEQAPARTDVPLAVPAQPDRDYQVQDVPLDIATPPPAAPTSVGAALGDTPAATSEPALPAATDEPLATVVPDQIPPRIDARTGEVIDPGTSGLPSAATGTAPVPAPAPAPAPPVAAAQQPPQPITQPPQPVSTPTATAAAPTAPAPATSTLPATSAGGRFVVSLGTFANQANAAQLRASLATLGFRVIDEAVNVSGKTASRLRVGPYAMRADAEAMRQKIAAANPGLKPVITELDSGSDTTPPPVSAPAPVGSGFAVQVGAFKDEAEANKLREQLRSARFAAYVERLNTEQGLLFRVRVGPESERGNAEKLRDAIRSRFNLTGNVVRHP